MFFKCTEICDFTKIIIEILAPFVYNVFIAASVDAEVGKEQPHYVYSQCNS